MHAQEEVELSDHAEDVGCLELDSAQQNHTLYLRPAMDVAVVNSQLTRVVSEGREATLGDPRGLRAGTAL